MDRRLVGARGDFDVEMVAAFGATIRYVPCMTPAEVLSGHPDVIWNDSPGASTGCSSTTRGRALLDLAVRVRDDQWRLTSCTVSSLSFVMRTV
jgi:hypothetical protein